MPDRAFPVRNPAEPIRSPADDAKAVPAFVLPACTSLGAVVDRELPACRRSGSSLVVLSIGLAGLETVVQQHGAAVEEELLQAAWSRLRRHLRAADLAVRVERSEFGAVLLNAAWPATAIVDARLSKALSRPYGLGVLEVALSVRTGAAIYPRAGATGEALAMAARQARAFKNSP